MTRQLTSFAATGLDLAPLDEPETREALLKLWREKGLVAFRGMAGGMEVQLSLFRDPLCIQIRAADSIQDQYLPRYDADAGLSERLNRQWLSHQFSSVQLTDISDGKRLRKVRN